MLLTFCYPPYVCSKIADDGRNIADVGSHEEVWHRKIGKSLFTLPVVEMQVYLITYQQAWDKEMGIAARYTLIQPDWEHVYATEFKSITGGDLHRLLDS
jgi:hypothetical protein